MSALTYAVGDIHGRYDLLLAALAWIEDHAGEKSTEIVFLGDYIDRGPDSRLVIERLMAGPSTDSQRFTCLLGNHEALLLASFHDHSARRSWLMNGGDATRVSYAGQVPDEHVRWIERRPRLHQDEHRYFVHAGLNPRYPVGAQNEDDLIWIREPFLSLEHDFGKHVVHGHTPNLDGPELRRFRTNLDVGAFWTGRLCVGIFDPDLAGGPLATKLVAL